MHALRHCAYEKRDMGLTSKMKRVVVFFFFFFFFFL